MAYRQDKERSAGAEQRRCCVDEISNTEYKTLLYKSWTRTQDSWILPFLCSPLVICETYKKKSPSVTSVSKFRYWLLSPPMRLGFWLFNNTAKILTWTYTLNRFLLNLITMFLYKIMEQFIHMDGRYPIKIDKGSYLTKSQALIQGSSICVIRMFSCSFLSLIIFENWWHILERTGVPLGNKFYV